MLFRSHGRLDAAERERMGVGDSLVRVAVGLESIDDIIADLDRGLAKLADRASSVSSSSSEEQGLETYAGDLTPQQAWDRLGDDEAALLVDVRTDAEWDYVGVPDLTAINKPLLKVSWKTYPLMNVNEAFVAQVEQVAPDPEAPLLFLCRSGVRSRDAAIAMTAAGYSRCYNVSQGFEGDKGPDSHRGLGGWKSAGLPWGQG